MDQGEHHLQSFSLCNRLYNFLMKHLTSYAFKTVTLGRPALQDLAKAQNRNSHERSRMVHPMPQQETPSEDVKQAINVKSPNPFATAHSHLTNRGQEDCCREVPVVQEDDGGNANGVKTEAPLPPVEAQARPPKKVVSINERVEEIAPVVYKRRMLSRKRSAEKLTSFEVEGDEHKQPLRSILKVGSDLGEKSSSFVNRADDG